MAAPMGLPVRDRDFARAISRGGPAWRIIQRWSSLLETRILQEIRLRSHAMSRNKQACGYVHSRGPYRQLVCPPMAEFGCNLCHLSLSERRFRRYTYEANWKCCN